MLKKSNIKIITPINIVGFILTLVAGWVDTIGLELLLDERSSFMSGRGATLGYWAFKGELKTFMKVAVVVVAFIIGAYVSTKITKKSGLTGGLLFTGILIIIAAFHTCWNCITIAAIILPMAMGSQNAATSLTPINRTTHLTGPATDIGINMATGNWNKVIFWILRWIGFPLGAIIGFHLVHMVNHQEINIYTTLFCPAAIIILTGIIQKLTIDIPLLDIENPVEEPSHLIH